MSDEKQDALPAWFTVQGLNDLDQVAEYITQLQREASQLRAGNTKLRSTIRELTAQQTPQASGEEG